MINYKVTYSVCLSLEKLMNGKGIQFCIAALSFTLYPSIVLQVKGFIIFGEIE
jgi:hypothetical protein